MICKFLVLEFRRHRIPLGRVWFQQDGATAYTSLALIATLTASFSNRLIQLWVGILGPLRSPDLSGCNFYLWDYLKEKVFSDKPKTLTEMQANIEWEICLIFRRILKKNDDKLPQTTGPGHRKWHELFTWCYFCFIMVKYTNFCTNNIYCKLPIFRRWKNSLVKNS